MTEPTAPPTDQIFGIAKKMTLELEKLPMHTHAAIVGLMKMGCEHRNVELQNQQMLAQQKANDEAMQEARQRHAQAAIQRQIEEQRRDERNAERMKQNIFTDGAANPEALNGGEAVTAPAHHLEVVR